MAKNKMAAYNTADLNKKIATGKLSTEDLALANEVIVNRLNKAIPAAKVETPKVAKTEKVAKAPKAKKTAKAPVMLATANTSLTKMAPDAILTAGQVVSFKPARNSKFRSMPEQLGTLKKVYPADTKGDEWLRVELEDGKKIFKLKKAIIAHN